MSDLRELWTRVNWIILPLLALGSLATLFLIGILSTTGKVFFVLFDTSFISGELVRLVLVGAYFLLIVRISIIVYSALPDWDGYNTDERAGAPIIFHTFARFTLLFTKYLVPVVLTAGSSISINSIYAGFIEQANFVLYLVAFIISSFMIFHLARNIGRQTNFNLKKFLTVSPQISDRPWKAVFENKLLVGWLVLLCLYSSFMLGVIRANALVSSDPVRLLLRNGTEIVAPVFGMTGAGVIVFREVSEPQPDAARGLVRYLDGKTNVGRLTLVTFDQIEIVEEVETTSFGLPVRW